MPDQNPSVRDLTPARSRARAARRPHLAGRCARAERNRAGADSRRQFSCRCRASMPAAIPEPAGREVVFSLPLRPPFRDRLVGGAGAGFRLWQPSRGRHFGLESRRTADRDMMNSEPRHSSPSALAVVAGCRTRARRRAGSASSIITIGRTIRIRPCSTNSPRRPASPFATTRSIPTIRLRQSSWPGSPAMTSWCRPRIFSPARSRPAFFRSSINRSCRISLMSGRKSPTSSRSTIPAISMPSITCGARPASATTSRT